MFLKCLVILLFCNFIDGQYYRERCTAPRIPHGYARVKQRFSFVKFMCDGGYTLVGNKYATCRHGHWDVPIPTCIRSGCHPLDEVKNAVIQSNHDNAWIMYFCYPGFELVGSSVVFCDGYRWNDTAPQCVDSRKSVKTSCDFEDSDLCGWRQDQLHDFDWIRLNLRTPSSFLMTGPKYDHTLGRNGNGYYMYIEGSSRQQNDTARLISPVMDEKLGKDGCFQLYYHMYGRGIGGLRVYQKPDSLTMTEVLNFVENGVNKYKLFERWGNQGNFWFASVSSLLDVSEDFQIVIEGIRGETFTSDIAIDDVAILQGENCTKAKEKAGLNPVPKEESSCVDRCGISMDPSSEGCDCNIVCVIYDNCCPDYLEVCEYTSNGNGTDDSDQTTPVSSSVQLPQTQRLVATTTAKPKTTTSTSTSTSTTTSTTTTSTTTTSTTTIPSTTSTTTRKARVTPTTRRPRPVTRPTVKTTTTTTTRRPTTTRAVQKPTTKIITSTRPTTTTPQTTVSYPTTTTSTTQATPVVTMQTSLKIVAEKKVENGGTNGVLIAVLVLLAAGVVCGALYAARAARARGTYLLARLRARARNDAEVRFIGADMDIDTTDE